MDTIIAATVIIGFPVAGIAGLVYAIFNDDHDPNWESISE